jgi:hypothetical protein
MDNVLDLPHVLWMIQKLRSRNSNFFALEVCHKCIVSIGKVFELEQYFDLWIYFVVAWM